MTNHQCSHVGWNASRHFRLQSITWKPPDSLRNLFKTTLIFPNGFFNRRPSYRSSMLTINYSSRSYRLSRLGPFTSPKSFSAARSLLLCYCCFRHTRFSPQLSLSKVFSSLPLISLRVTFIAYTYLSTCWCNQPLAWIVTKQRRALL